MQNRLAFPPLYRFYEAQAEWLAEGRVGRYSAIVIVLAAYCCLQVIAMTLLSQVVGTGVGVDDAEQLMYLGEMQAGYGGSQPPLYTWLGSLAAQFFGPSVLTLKLVKYSMIFVAGLSIFLAVQEFGYSRRTAGTALFGIVLFPQVLWEMQHTLSHSVAAFTLSSLLLLALAWLLQKQSATTYAAFGLAMGGAILAKYNNLLLLSAIVASMLSLSETRAVILNRRFAISIGIAILVCLPTLYWNAAHPGEIVARGHKFGIAPDQERLVAAWLGFKNFTWAAFNFAVLPVVIFAVALVGARTAPYPAGGSTTAERLLWRTIIAGIVIALSLVIVIGATTFRDRWMLPLLLFLPIVLAMRLDGLGSKGKTAQSIVIGVAAGLAILILPVSWYMHLYGGDSRGSIARIDYTSLYRDMVASGSVRTVVSDWHWSGNLRLIDPNLTTITSEVPDFAEQLREPVVLALLDGIQPDDTLLDLLVKAGYSLEGDMVAITVPQLFSPANSSRQVNLVRLVKAPAQALAPTMQ